MILQSTWLLAAGFIAGFVDSIAGGGGLISVPALLTAGLLPAQALATNKLQSSIGTSIAVRSYLRSGLVDRSHMWLGICVTFTGAATGTLIVQGLDTRFLYKLIPLLLLAVAVYFIFQPSLGSVDRRQRMGHVAFYLSVGTVIGFYDGFFGPGTGSFWAVAFVTLLGFNLLKATATTKVMNFTSNVAALVFFAWGGNIVWRVGATMAVGQVLGARLGSSLVIRIGPKLVRPILIVMSLAMTASLWLRAGH